MIPTQVNLVSYDGDGVNAEFPFDAVVLNKTDIVVIEETIATGAMVTKSLESDYFVIGTPDAVGRYSGVTIIAAVPPTALVRWSIYQDPSITQGVDLVDNGLLPVESQIELPLDRLTIIAQRLRSLLDRCLRQSDGDSVNIGRLPVKASRLSKFLAFDANGDPIAAAGASANLGPVSSFINTLLDDADAATARTTLGVSRSGLNIAAPMPAVRGLRGSRHATTTKYTLSSAQYVVLTNSSGDSVLVTAAASLTLDATVSGPIANGRDQAGAFSNQWVNIYYIWNGTTLSVIGSLANPPTGPTLPSGYTHFAYATTIYYTSFFQNWNAVGPDVHNDVAAITSLTSTSVASIGSLANTVPPIATHAFGGIVFTGTSTGGGVIQMIGSLYSLSTTPFFEAAQTYLFASGSPSVSYTAGRTHFRAPLLVSQTLYYVNTVTFGSSPSMDIKIRGYSVPNGDTA